jgi:preprotein translocase subunit SecD
MDSIREQVDGNIAVRWRRRPQLNARRFAHPVDAQRVARAELPSAHRGGRALRPETIGAIRLFQQRETHLIDGRIDPHGPARQQYQAAAGLIEAMLDSGQKIYVGRRLVTSGDVVEARLEQNGGQFSIVIELSAPAAMRVFVATVDHARGSLAFVVNGQVVSAPLVRGPVANRIKIDGTFSREEAKAVVRELTKHLINK